MGPKPFAPPKLNESESFDKVFCVPPVPCNKPQNGVHKAATEPNNKDVTPASLPLLDHEPSPMDVDGENTSKETLVLTQTSDAEKGTGSGSRTPTTAERRKMFESIGIVEKTPDESGRFIVNDEILPNR